MSLQILHIAIIVMFWHFVKSFSFPTAICRCLMINWISHSFQQWCVIVMASLAVVILCNNMYTRLLQNLWLSLLCGLQNRSIGCWQKYNIYVLFFKVPVIVPKMLSTIEKLCRGSIYIVMCWWLDMMFGFIIVFIECL